MYTGFLEIYFKTVQKQTVIYPSACIHVTKPFLEKKVIALEATKFPK